MGNINEAPVVHFDNVDDNIFTINIPSNFTLSSFDSGHSVMIVT